MKLSQAELYIMVKIWQEDRPLYFDDILELVEDRNWAQSTLRTFLARIVDKGYLEVEKSGRVNIYHIRKSKKELGKKTGGLAKRLYNNSIKNFIAELYESKSLDSQDILELRDYLNKEIEGWED